LEAFLHQFLSGLANGGIYASIALALVMIYQATHHINFAQGEQGMFSAYVALMLVQAGFPYWAAFALALAFGFVTGVAIERIIIRRFEQAPVLAVVVVFLGLLFTSTASPAGSSLLCRRSHRVPSGLGNRYLSAHEIGMIGGHWRRVADLPVFRFTPLGLAMRAAAQNPDASRRLGSGSLDAGARMGARRGDRGDRRHAAPIVYIGPT
jgi:branched-chain amino acid transport system permease protein